MNLKGKVGIDFRGLVMKMHFGYALSLTRFSKKWLNI